MQRVHHNTTLQQRKLLLALGFVRVDGLPLTGPTDAKVVVVKDLSHLGTITCNNGTYCLTTDGGEIWVSRGTIKRDDPEVQALLAEIAPGDVYSYAYFSNGEETSAYNIINRLGDPDWTVPAH